MRLSENQVKIILKVINEIFGEVEVYLFGSRLDDSKRGGDIDLFVIPKIREKLFAKKIRAESRLELILDLPVDIVVHYDFNRFIEKEALKGVKLAG
ncbi:nucleotidyltransferase domain-containing protein [Caminibacter sp.]